MNHEYVGVYSVEHCMIVCGHCKEDNEADTAMIGKQFTCEFCGTTAEVVNADRGDNT